MRFDLFPLFFYSSEVLPSWTDPPHSAFIGLKLLSSVFPYLKFEFNQIDFSSSLPMTIFLMYVVLHQLSMLVIFYENECLLMFATSTHPTKKFVYMIKF